MSKEEFEKLAQKAVNNEYNELDHEVWRDEMTMYKNIFIEGAKKGFELGTQKQLSEYKEKLKAEVIRIAFKTDQRNAYIIKSEEVLTIIDKIQ